MLQPALYIVATPIGNLDDITARAVQVLSKATVVAAEDTRHTQRLLTHLGVKAKLESFHDYSDDSRVAYFLDKVEAGESVALVSDAGTPLISDPGYSLVATAHQRGIQVVPVPGACAMVAALSAAGLPSDSFTFEGFLPAKATGRKGRLSELAKNQGTLIFYESPHRIESMLSDVLEVLGDRPAAIARELTKMFETITKSTVSELIGFTKQDDNQRKGEFVVLIEGNREQTADGSDIDTDHLLTTLLAELPVKQSAALAATILGVKKKPLYERALQLSGKK